jgi:hypothetical protein
MTTRFYICIIAIMISAPVILHAQSDQREARITELRSRGPGCPAGTVSSYLSPDGQVFTTTFDQFSVEVDLASPQKRATKACIIVAKIKVPAGWSYAMMSLDTRGFAHLDRGVSATLNSQYRVGMKPPKKVAELSLNGPLQDNYVRSINVATTDLIWTGCNQQLEKNFMLATQISVVRNGRNGGGLMTVDTIDGELHQTYRLLWRRCRPEQRDAPDGPLPNGVLDGLLTRGP